MSDNQKIEKIQFLKGRKVILRPFAKSDIPRLTRWINDPEVREFIANVRPWTEKQEEAWFDRLGTNDTDITFCIETKKGIPIGCMGIHQINWKDRIATTGALIGEKKYWGRGYGTDAKMILLDYAFNELNLHKICSRVIEYNTRSLNYSLHCGYKKEGVRREHFFRKGKYWDMIELGLLRPDWLPIWERYQKTGSVR